MSLTTAMGTVDSTTGVTHPVNRTGSRLMPSREVLTSNGIRIMVPMAVRLVNSAPQFSSMLWVPCLSCHGMVLMAV